MEPRGTGLEELEETLLTSVPARAVELAAPVVIGLVAGVSADSIDTGLLVSLTTGVFELFVASFFPARRLSSLETAVHGVGRGLDASAPLVHALTTAACSVASVAEHPARDMFEAEWRDLRHQVDSSSTRARELALGRYCTDLDQWAQIARLATTEIIGVSNWTNVSTPRRTPMHDRLITWWTEGPGRGFLECNAQRKDASVTVMRVFIVDDPVNPPKAFEEVSRLLATYDLPYRLAGPRQGHISVEDPIGWTVVDGLIAAYSSFMAGGLLTVSIDPRKVRELRSDALTLWDGGTEQARPIR